MSTDQSGATERLNQIYATEASPLAPEWRTVVAALLADEATLNSMTLKDYAELYNTVLDVEAYRREFPEDAPFTHPPTREE